MDQLKLLIATLSREEQKELGVFIQRQKKKKHRKDLELYKLLLQKQTLSNQALLNKLYPEDANAVAYHALRKRLMDHITAFILLKRQENDVSAAASVRGLLSLASYLFERQAGSLAWNLLHKAEKLAQQHEQYELLNSVYNLQLEHWATGKGGDPTPVLAKRNHNKQLADQEEHATLAISWITYQLQEAKKQGKTIDFANITAQVLEQYSLMDVVTGRPKLLYQLVSITRSAVLVKKTFFPSSRT